MMPDTILHLFETAVLGKPLWTWAVFAVVVIALVAFDLGILNRKDHEIGVRESLLMSLGYITVGTLFGCWVWYEMDADHGMDYLTGFFVEKSLSLDNVFVISLIFTYFKIPRQYQHRVLFYGILGVVLLRGIVIGLGTALVENFSWVLLLFAAFLIYTGIKMLFADDEADDIGDNAIVRFCRKHLRVMETLHGSRFFVRMQDPATGKMALFATPLFLALVVVELADVVFAMDSIPAIFAITTDPYVVFTSNIFAILGLRALYFALAAILHRFAYLKYALSLVLVFIGGKVFWGHFFGKVPPLVSLSITLGILALGVIFSFSKTGKERAGE